MKRLLRKGNPVARLIAMWVAFIMLLTPLYQHSGLRNDTKAATDKLEFTLDVEAAEFATATDGKVTVSLADDSTYIISGDSKTHTMMYWDNGSDVIITGNITGTLAYEGTEVTYDKGVVIYDEGTGVSPTLPYDETLEDPSTAQVVGKGKTYAIYIKINDAMLQTQNNMWCLLAAYKLDSKQIGDIYWIDAAGNNLNTSNPVTDAYIPNIFATSNEKDVFLGDFKYSVAQGYNANYNDYIGKLKDITPGTNIKDTDLYKEKGDNNYVFFIEYNDDLGDTSYIPVGNSIKIDRTAPTLLTEWTSIQDIGNKYNPVKADVDGITYLENSADSKNYLISFKAAEENYAAVVDIKFYKKDGTLAETVSVPYYNGGSVKQPQYTKEKFLPSTLENGIVYEMKVALKDSLGNIAIDENGNQIETLIATVCPIDPALKATYTISDLNDVVDADNKLDSPTKLQSKVSVTVTSGNQLQSLSIFEDKNNNGVQDDDETAFVNKENLTGASKKSGLYTYEINYTIPSVADEGSYANVKLLVTDSVGSQIYTISGDNGFVYDQTNPVVTLKDGVGIYKWDGSSWQPLPADEIVDDDYNLDTTKDEKFKIVVDVQDDTSGIKSVTAYYNNKTGARQDIDTLTVDNTITTDNTCYSSGELTSAQLNGFIANSTNGRLYIVVEAIDNVGLNGIVGANPTLVIPDKDLRIDTATLTVGGSDTPVDLSNATSMDFDNKELFKLTITASSGYPISKIEICKDVDYTDPNATGELVFDAISITENDYTQDSVTKRYSVTKEILVPNSIDADTLNLLLNDVYVRVYDNHTPDENDVTDYNVISQELGNLLYDATKPVITDLNGNTFVKNDGKWYQALAGENYIEVDAKITTGPQAYDNESTFEDGKITYTIQGSAANDTESPVSNGVVINTTDTPARVSATANVKVPESKNANGTTVTFNAVDKAGNELDKDNVIVRIVDGTNPRIQTFTVNGNSSNSIPLGKTVKIEADVWDNLAIDKVVIEVKQTDGTTYYSKPFDEDSINYNSTEVTKKVSYEVTLPDGSYTASIKAYDKVGLETLDKTTNFMVDSTPPVVDVDITSGKEGKTNYFYSTDVTLTFTKSDKNGVNETIVDKTTGENLTNKIVWDASGQKGTYIVTGDGLHTIEISAKDATGNPAVPKAVSFIKDTVNPTVAATINGGIIYQDSLGVVVLTSNATTTFTVSEANEDVDAFYYQIIKAVPDQATETGTYLKSALRSFTFADEGEYTINAYSVDMANRQGPTKTVRFRIDKTAPSINIGGIASGGTSSSAVTVSLNMQELYWNDASGTVEIYMKSGEGFGEELIDEITYTPTGRNTSIARTFSESGVYRIEFNAQDSAGHTSTASSTFTIDTEAPVVTLEGVSNYDVTDKDVVISSTITDKFYASKRVTITGTITDETGKVTPLTIDNYSATANPTTINETFSADGIYDLTINCVDVAGNSDSKSVHFIIDKSNPVIGDLSDIDGKILTSFEWDKDLDELVSDLTVCDVHMYLNGKEYNGEDAVADGSYVLLITAEDELGHIVEKSVEFVLDTKEPVFIVTGVEDGEKRIEPYNISVSLQLEEDTLTSVTLNGKVITINGNVATFDVTEIGEYKLYMEAVDEAGNVSSAEYEFELESENDFNIWIIIAIIAVLLLIIIFIVIKKRQQKIIFR